MGSQIMDWELVVASNKHFLSVKICASSSRLCFCLHIGLFKKLFDDLIAVNKLCKSF